MLNTNVSMLNIDKRFKIVASILRLKYLSKESIVRFIIPKSKITFHMLLIKRILQIVMSSIRSIRKTVRDIIFIAKISES